MPAKQSKNSSKLRKLNSRMREQWRHASWGKRAFAGLMALLIVWTAVQIAVAQWYIASQAHKPMVYGVTFIPSYAEQLGVDPQETMQALIDDMGVRQFRLVSYWNRGEAVQGTYDFSELDWQMELAKRSGSKVSLAIGLRQPRWPECHMPSWAASMPMEQWSPPLQKYMQATIERYRNHPSLESYQLENEFFMEVFGECPDHTRQRLADELALVKRLDPDHKVIISRSNNWVGIPIREPLPDEVGVSVYKRVWEKTILNRYFEYPMPAQFYAMLGGFGKIFTGRDLMLHELQAEPWLPEGYAMNDVADIAEQNKSMDADRLRTRIQFGRDTGLREVYLWGAEWWYWRKEVAKDPSLWNVARDEISVTDANNQ